MMKKTTPSVTAALVIAAGMSVSGCQSMPEPQEITIAVTATSIDPAPALGPLTQLVTKHASDALLPEDGRITVVAPDHTEHVDLTPMRGSDVESVPAKAEKLIAHNLAALETVLSQAATTKEGLDLIGVLDQALEQTPAGGHVILESSGFSTVAPLDLNQAGNWIGNPKAFVQGVNQEDLPNAVGKHLTFAGLGYPNPASNQEQAGPAVRAALTTIMLGLCTRMGAASCEALPGPFGQDPATATNRAAPVSLNQIDTHCVGQTSIDASIAFDLNTAVLLPAADAILSPIAEILDRCPAGSIINATGHSALLPDSAPGAGSDLEHKRAQAVLARLVYLGAPTTTIGKARSGGQLVDNLPNGTFDEALATKNRTVVLTMGL